VQLSISIADVAHARHSLSGDFIVLQRRRDSWLLLLSCLCVLFEVSCAVASSETVAGGLDCGALAADLRKDPLTSGPFKIVGITKLYEFQDRPYVRRPTGARLTLRSPQGVTEAEHRAAACTMRRASGDAISPLAVPGSNVRVARRGSQYDLHITAKDRAAALEIQRRADHLRRSPR
jgi:hypothetical protein